MQPKWINQSGTSLALTRIKLAQMDSIEIKAIIKQGENSQVEFKECQDRISHSVYETVCSFLNYKGETPSLYSTYDSFKHRGTETRSVYSLSFLKIRRSYIK